MGETVDPGLIAQGLASPDRAIRRQAYVAAVALGAPMVPFLLDLVAQGNPPAAHAAELALERIVGAASASGQEEVQAVRRALGAALAQRRGKEDRARIQAARLLGLIGNDERPTVVPLKEALLEGGPVGEAALEALQRIPGRRVTEALIAALHRVEPSRKGAVLLALGSREAGRVLPELARWLREGNEEMQVAAVQALGCLRSPQAVPFLQEAATAPSKALRRAAADALLLLAQPSP